jgi:ribonuclease HI
MESRTSRENATYYATHSSHPILKTAPHYLPTSSNATLSPASHYTPITLAEVNNVIRHLNYASSSGHDGISYRVIAQFQNALTPALRNLCDVLCRHSAFPDTWKKACCVVIPKPGKTSYTTARSYRPISLLPCLSKVFDRLAANRIAQSAINCLAISPTQMGARCHYSVIDALLKILWAMSADLSIRKVPGKQPYYPTLLAHDIEGAFNNTNPSLLYQVMQQRGMPPYLCAWTKAFTTNWTLSFSFTQQIEDPKPFLCGLPQGSPASPVLFLIYANAMLEVQHNPGHEINTSYLDDTSLLQSSVSIPHTIRWLRERSQYQIACGKHLGLSFSPSKSELLHCLPRDSKAKAKDLCHHPPLTINDRTIQPSRSIKYLGVHIDESLTFKQHAIASASHAKAALGALLFLRHQGNGIPVYIAWHLILTVILPKMLWASPAWWTGSDRVLSPLSVIYNTAARCATGLPPSTQITHLLTCAHLPPLNTYLDYLSARYTIRLLFLHARHSLSGLPTTPHCPISAPGTSRLKDLIKHLTTGRLEDRSVAPITFNVDMAPAINLNKHDEPARRHSSWVSSLPIGTFLLYTDGSKLDNGQVGCGAATYEITGDGPWQMQHHQCNLGTQAEVFDAELHAVPEGLLLLPTTSHRQPTTAYLCIDNQSAIQTLSNNKHNHQFARKALTRAQNLFHNGWKLLTMWTPTHTNIPGNEIPDNLAKAGARSMTSCPATVTTAAWLHAEVR